VIPEDLRYSSEHEWVRTQDGGDTTDGVTVARVGITDYAQN
jgi:glycine cleavage system H lipoate-binding protein